MLNRNHPSPMSVSALPVNPSSSFRKQLYGVALLLCLAIATYLYYRVQTVNNELELASSISSVESATKSASIPWPPLSTESIASDAVTTVTPEPANSSNENSEKLVVRERDESEKESPSGKEEQSEKEESSEKVEETQPAPESNPKDEEKEEEEVEDASAVATPYTWELLLTQPPGSIAPRISSRFFKPMHLQQIHNPTAVRIFLVGDSLTQGAGYPNNIPHFTHPYQIGFEALWKKVYPNISLSIVADALSGECVLSACRTKSIPDRVEAHMSSDAEGFDIVVMLGGTNDLSQHRGKEVQLTEAIFKAHQRILEGTKLADGSVKVPRTTMLTLPEISFNYDTPADIQRLTLNTDLRSWCSGMPVQPMEQVAPPEEGTCLLVDTAELMPRKRLEEEKAGKLWCDSVHPSEIGYDFMGEIIFRHVEHYLKFD